MRPRLARRPDGVPIPLSHAQRAIWRADALAGGAPIHNEARAFRLTGHTDLAALDGAVADVVRRHPVFRTRFVVDGAEVHQEHVPNETGRLTVVDATPTDLDAIVAAECARPFDIAQPHLLRAVVVRSGPEDAVLVLIAHHLVVDAWTVAIFLSDLAASYARRLGRPATAALDRSPVDFGDFAWSEGTDGDHSAGLTYWRELLLASPASNPLPVELTEPIAPIAHAGAWDGDLVDLSLSPELVTDLAGLAAANETTLAGVVLTGIQTLLRRLCRGPVRIGLPVAIRRSRQLATIAGPLINVILCTATPEPNEAFAVAAQRIGAELRRSLRHSTCPLDLIVDDLELRPAGNLFDVLVAVQNGPSQALDLYGVATEALPAHSGSAKYELAFYVAPTDDGGMKLTIEYRTAHFRRETIIAWGDALIETFRGALARPGVAALRLPVDGTFESPATEVDRSVSNGATPTNVSDSIRSHARTRPDAVAARTGGRALTYSQLDRSADAIARALPVVPGDRVGVCMSRSPLLLAVILGVWRRGAVYVPLDQRQPAERRQVMLADSGAAVLVTDAPLADLAGGPRVVRADELPDTVATDDGDIFQVEPDQLAYLMYTSGSSGLPKAASVTHRSLTNLLTSVVRYPGLQASDVLLSVTSPAFDISLLEFFAPMVAGATVWLAPDEAVHDGEALAGLIRTSQASVMQATPSLWRLVLEASTGGLAIRAFCGGEPLDRVLADSLLGRTEQVWNLYGPTETTIWSTVGRLHAGEPVHVGQPVAETSCHILDDLGEPTLPGAIGELFIGGAGVAEGYWNRPDLTTAAFGPDPLGLVAGSRFYRTGDLARRSAGGAISIVGRVDDQVKIRGHRVEPSEIAAQLARDDQVRAAAVVAVGDPTVRLVAFLVPHGNAQIDHDQVRRSLRTRLPEAMIPAHFVTIDELPLMVSGKVDRATLVRLYGAGAGIRAAPTRIPRTEAQLSVARIWSEVLGENATADETAADVETSFLDAGGNSLLATKLLARLRRSLGIHISLPDFFAAPTITALATHAPDVMPTTVGPTLSTNDRSTEFDTTATHQLRQLWLLEQLNGDATAYNIAAHADIAYPVDALALAAAFDNVVARNSIFSSTLELRGDGVVLCSPRTVRSVDFRVVDISGLPSTSHDDAIEQILCAEVARKFELAQAPLLRACLVRATARRCILVVTTHHAAMDTLSGGLLVDALQTAYHERVRGSTEHLSRPQPSLQYRDYARQQREHDDDPDLAYWLGRLDGYPGVVNLATDIEVSTNRATRAGARELPADHELGGVLRRLAKEANTTPFTVLLAGFAVVIGRYAQADDIVIGVPVANRSDPDLDAVIGCFTNTIPVRVRLDPRRSFSSLVAQTRDRLAADIDHADVPADRLISRLGLHTDLRASPLVQVALVFDDQRLPDLDLGGGGPAPIRGLAPHYAKYDLTLHAQLEADALSGWLEYATTRFSPDLIARLVADFSHLLASAGAEPRVPIGLIALPSEDERATDTTHRLEQERQRSDDAVYAAFQQHARLSPHAIAIDTGDETTDYATLDAWSDDLAEQIDTLRGSAGGVAGGQRFIAVSLPPGPARIAALLAIAKAGDVLLAIDAADPLLRIRELLDDAKPWLIIATADLAGRGLEPAAVDGPVLLTLADGPPPEPRSRARAPRVPSPRDFCLVYTSGTTGAPKGIVLTHAAFVQFSDWYADTFGVDATSRIAQWAPFTYDAAYTEVFAALSKGATLCLPPADVRRSPVVLLDWLGREQVTHLQTIPTFFELMTKAIESGYEAPGSLRHVLLAGEALPVDVAKSWRDGRYRFRLHNLYGPTECILATHRELRHEDDIDGSVPIGSPFRGRAAYVVDEHLRPVPRGVVGELVLDSPFLAGEYFRRPADTAAAYAAMPAYGDKLMYRTGDLVRRRTDGELAFVGRRGSQVKIRGNRVELEGVEAILRAHSQVSDGAVVAEKGAGGPRLVAFVVSDCEPAAIQAYLAERLPAYAVPQEVVAVDQIPRTRTNKRDRGRLIRPPRPAAGPAGGGELEAAITRAWCEVLDRDDIAPGLTFFEAGGDSLRAAHLQIVLNRVLEREIAIIDIFAYPRVAEFARSLRAETGRSAAATAGDERGRRRTQLRHRRANAGRQHDRRDIEGESDGP